MLAYLSVQSLLMPHLSAQYLADGGSMEGCEFVLRDLRLVAVDVRQRILCPVVVRIVVLVGVGVFLRAVGFGPGTCLAARLCQTPGGVLPLGCSAVSDSRRSLFTRPSCPTGSVIAASRVQRDSFLAWR